MITRIFLGHKEHDKIFNSNLSPHKFERLLKKFIKKHDNPDTPYDRLGRGSKYFDKNMMLTFFPNGSSFVKKLELKKCELHDKYIFIQSKETLIKHFEFPIKKDYLDEFFFEEFEYKFDDIWNIIFMIKITDNSYIYEICLETTKLINETSLDIDTLISKIYNLIHL